MEPRYAGSGVSDAFICLCCAVLRVPDALFVTAAAQATHLRAVRCSPV